MTPETKELPTSQLAAAWLNPPRLAPGFNSRIHLLLPGLGRAGRPRRHRSTWRAR